VRENVWILREMGSRERWEKKGKRERGGERRKMF
jgi:hypothetical protein